GFHAISLRCRRIRLRSRRTSLPRSRCPTTDIFTEKKMQKIDEKVYAFVEEAEKKIAGDLARVDAVALANQAKVLNAFHEFNVGQRHFAQTNGYGYDDIGRDTLASVFAYAFGAESAVVSPQIVS